MQWNQQFSVLQRRVRAERHEDALLGLHAAVPERFKRVSRKLKGLLGKLQPPVSPVLGVAQLRFHHEYFFLQVIFLAKELLVINELPVTHLGEVIKLALGIGKSFVLHFVNFCTVFDFLVILTVQHFQRPVPELGEDGDFPDLGLNLTLKLCFREYFVLGTFDRSLLLGAVVVRVASRFSRAFDELGLFLRRDHAPALSTAYEACEGE